jgi:myo-inositol 2-dehydrogenase / D-chiro-inositol 1-dehydrogenase
MAQSHKALRIAVLGAGGHSELEHGPPLRRCAAERPGLELAAVCDLDADRAQRYATEFGFAAVYTDLEAMLSTERLDGLVAVTPLNLTCEMGCALMRRGIPLLIEKPPGRNAAEARRLVRAAKETGAAHMVSLNRRFSPAFAIARDWLREHASDRPIDLVQARMLRIARREADFLTGTGIHCVDGALSWLPGATAASAQRWNSPKGGQAASAVVTAADGRRITLTIVPDAGVHEETYDLSGPEYLVRIDAASCAVTVHEAGEVALRWDAPADMPSWERSGALNETRAFLDAIAGGKPFAPDLPTAAASLVVAEAVAAGGRHHLGKDAETA